MWSRMEFFIEWDLLMLQNDLNYLRRMTAVFYESFFCHVFCDF